MLPGGSGRALKGYGRGVDEQLQRLGIIVSRRRRVPGDRRSIERRAVRIFPAGGAKGVDECPVENVGELTAGGRHPGETVEALERGAPSPGPPVCIKYHETIVEGFEDVLVEFAHPPELLRLQMKLTVEAAVFNCRCDLSGHRRQQRQILAVERFVRVLAPKRQHGNRAALEDAGDEVVDSRITPKLDLFSDEQRRDNRVVEGHRVAGVETLDE